MWRLSVVSFTTTSSAVSLPFQIEDGKERFGISDRINKLVMPLGMTLNSNGLSLFLALAIVTVAQAYQIQLSWGSFASGLVVLVGMLGNDRRSRRRISHTGYGFTYVRTA